jgi:DNA-binding NarL/FixJ family response regulator
MDNRKRIFVISGTGNSRQSLAALLGALSQVDIVWVDWEGLGGKDYPPLPDPDLLLVDWEPSSNGSFAALEALRQRWPAARLLVLVDRARWLPAAYALGVDCALTHISPAGELLRSVQQLIGCAAVRRLPLSSHTFPLTSPAGSTSSGH